MGDHGGHCTTWVIMVDTVPRVGDYDGHCTTWVIMVGTVPYTRAEYC